MRIVWGCLYLARLQSPTLGFLHPVRPVLWDRDSSLLNSATILHIPQRMARKKNQKKIIFFRLDNIGGFHGIMIQRVFV
jgi:hypothetical protein